MVALGLRSVCRGGLTRLPWLLSPSSFQQEFCWHCPLWVHTGNTGSRRTPGRLSRNISLTEPEGTFLPCRGVAAHAEPPTSVARPSVRHAAQTYKSPTAVSFVGQFSKILQQGSATVVENLEARLTSNTSTY